MKKRPKVTMVWFDLLCFALHSAYTHHISSIFFQLVPLFVLLLTDTGSPFWLITVRSLITPLFDLQIA